MVFRPLDPVRIGPWRLQGLFLRRQAPVSERFAALATAEMVTVRAVMTEIMTGEHAARARELIEQHLTPAARERRGGDGAEVAGTRRPARVAPAIRRPVDPCVARRARRSGVQRERASGLAEIFATRMKAMTPAEFQDVLRPAFHEDEWIIIFLGAVFGFLAGWVQLVVGFQ